jgi:tryptophan synthase beta chain
MTQIFICGYCMS